MLQVNYYSCLPEVHIEFGVHSLVVEKIIANLYKTNDKEKPGEEWWLITNIIVFIDGNGNNYVAKDVEEANGDEMEDHLVTDHETLNTGP